MSLNRIKKLLEQDLEKSDRAIDLKRDAEDLIDKIRKFVLDFDTDDKSYEEIKRITKELYNFKNNIRWE